MWCGMCDMPSQVQLARLALHEVLQLPDRERMAYIAHSRLLRQQKKEREVRGRRRGR